MDGSGGGHARPGVAGAAPVPHHQVGGGRGAGLLHLQPGLATAHSPPSQGLQVRHPYRIIKTGRQRSSLLHGWGRNFEPFSGKDDTKKVSGRTYILGGCWFDVV